MDVRKYKLRDGGRRSDKGYGQQTRHRAHTSCETRTYACTCTWTWCRQCTVAAYHLCGQQSWSMSMYKGETSAQAVPNSIASHLVLTSQVRSSASRLSVCISCLGLSLATVAANVSSTPYASRMYSIAARNPTIQSHGYHGKGTSWIVRVSVLER
jgi:hypothetical protein